jgi:site-specific recombinase XerD
LRELSEIQSAHVASYIERLTKTHAAPSVKQLLAAIRMLFNWLVVGQIVAHESPLNFNHPVWLLGLGELLKKS